MDVNENRVMFESPIKSQAVKGWFAFFLFVIGLGSIASLVYGIATLDLDDYYNSKLFASVEILYKVIYLLLAVYTIWSVSKRKLNAIFLCKTTAIFLFISNLLVLAGGDFETSGLGSLRTTISSFGWSVIWILYFIFSEQVNRLFPKEKRKVFLRDKILLVLLILPMIFGLCYVIYLGVAGKSIEINESTLAQNERTDGVIAFIVPEEYSCTPTTTDNLTVFHLTNEDCYITIVGAVDMDNSDENANEYFRLLKDESLSTWEEKCMLDNTESKGKLAIYHRTYKYIDIDGLYLPLEIGRASCRERV